MEKTQIAELVAAAAKLPQHEIAAILEVPRAKELGDFALPCFKLAAKLQRDPKLIARELASKIKLPKDSLIKDFEVIGPYINFFMNEEKIAERIFAEIYIKKTKFGESSIGKNMRVIVEFSGLNPNKPAHIGNARNTCLGDSVSRILEKTGFDIIGMDYINDLGLPTAAVLWAVKNLGEELPKRKKFLKEDHWQGAVYADIMSRAEGNDKLLESVHNMLHILEKQKDKKLLKVQRDLIEACVEAQYKTWARMKAFHDVRIYESDIVYSGLFEDGINWLVKTGKLEKETRGENKGCYIIRLAQHEAFKGMLKPDKILIRADGTATYTGKDVILQLWKFGLLKDRFRYKLVRKYDGRALFVTWKTGKLMKGRWNNASLVINVIGTEQKYPQQVIYYTLKSLGYETQFKNSYHLAYGLIGFGGEAKISSRVGAAGLMVDKILDEAVGRAYKEVEKRNPELSEKQKRELAEKIGVSAVRYYLVKFSPELFIQFDWNRVLSFEGDAGPYLQYALVRANKIMKKVKIKPKLNVDPGLLKLQEEKELIKKIAKFPEVVEKSANNYSPHLIAEYARELADLFSAFYEKAPVMKAENKKLQAARLLLVWAFAQTLKNALNLLGIEEVEVM